MLPIYYGTGLFQSITDFWSLIHISSTYTNCWFALKLTLSTTKGWTNKLLHFHLKKLVNVSEYDIKKLITASGLLFIWVYRILLCNSSNCKNTCSLASLSALGLALSPMRVHSWLCLKSPNLGLFLTFLLAFFKLWTLHLFFFSSCSSPTSTSRAFKCLSKTWYTRSSPPPLPSPPTPPLEKEMK